MSGAADTAVKWTVLGVLGIGVAYWLFNEAKSGAGAAIDNLADDIGGGIYEATHADANLAVQTTVQQALAALKAAGNPQPGTQAYNDIVEEYGIAGAPLASG